MVEVDEEKAIRDFTRKLGDVSNNIYTFPGEEPNYENAYLMSLKSEETLSILPYEEEAESGLEYNLTSTLRGSGEIVKVVKTARKSTNSMLNDKKSISDLVTVNFNTLIRDGMTAAPATTKKTVSALLDLYQGEISLSELTATVDRNTDSRNPAFFVTVNIVLNDANAQEYSFEFSGHSEYNPSHAEQVVAGQHYKVLKPEGVEGKVPITVDLGKLFQYKGHPAYFNLNGDEIKSEEAKKLLFRQHVLDLVEKIEQYDSKIIEGAQTFHGKDWYEKHRDVVLQYFHENYAPQLEVF
jgi:hypothetical protein